MISVTDTGTDTGKAAPGQVPGMAAERVGAQVDAKRRATLADVAAAAGVSKMSASRALRGAGDVSGGTMDKVRRAAKALGYVGNHMAASLSGRRSGLIGVVVPSVSNIVFAEVLSGIAEEIEGSGLQPVFGVTDYDPDREHEVIRNMLSWNPAGLIVTGLDQPEDTRRLLANADVPVVQIMDTDGTPVDACVGLSHHAAGAAMAAALVQRGRRRFAYVGSRPGRDNRAAKRLAGFREGLARHGLDLLATGIGEGPSTIRAGRQLSAEVLERRPDLDCIYYSNDDLAAGGAFHCLAQGVSVPGTLTLAGFNGLELVESLPVVVATTRTPRREIGRAAAQIVLARDRTGKAPGARRIEFKAAIHGL